MIRRLYLSISHHGLGHLAQTAPVVMALAMRQPNLEFIIQSGLSKAQLAARLPLPFQYIGEPAETAFVMHDAIRVDIEASRVAFAAFHADWSTRVDRLAKQLKAWRIDTVLSNVAYLPLAASASAGIPAWAFCSLNWADIYAHYLGCDAIYATMCAAYGQARFMAPQPSMPMPSLAVTASLEPLAAKGVKRRTHLARMLQIDVNTRWILIGMGGFSWRGSEDLLPEWPGTVWLLPPDWPVQRNDQRAFADAGVPFLDLLASVDMVFTKPGYGSFVEAATQGLDVLYLQRPDWPESDALTTWLRRHARTVGLDASTLTAERMGDAIKALEQQTKPTPPQATGADILACWILGQEA